MLIQHPPKMHTTMLRKPSWSLLEQCDVCLRRRVLTSSIHHARHSSSSAESAQIPPESPQFIHIPRSPQQSNVVVRQMKGTLPVPRKVFWKDEDKTSKTFLANTTPEPFLRNDTVPRAPTQETKDWIRRKSAAAALRRKNMRHGLWELKSRENRADRRQARITEKQTTEHQLAVSAPERNDERLSRPSILKFMGSPQIWQGDKELKAKIFAERKARYEALQSVKADEKQTALHTLYVNAKEFIVTHEQLEDRIDEVFSKGFYAIPDHKYYGVWDEFGFPENTHYLLGAANQAAGAAVDQGAGFTEVTRERLQRVAEELTGGKMDTDP